MGETWRKLTSKKLTPLLAAFLLFGILITPALAAPKVKAPPVNFADLSCTDCPKAVGDAVDSEVTVDNCAEIVDVSLYVDVSGNYSGDMILNLSNGEVSVTADPGGLCPTPDILAIYDDEGPNMAASECANAPPGINGILRPAQSFKNFIGFSGNGTWTLTVTDGFIPADELRLNDWRLEVLCNN